MVNERRKVRGMSASFINTARMRHEKLEILTRFSICSLMRNQTVIPLERERPPALHGAEGRKALPQMERKMVIGDESMLEDRSETGEVFVDVEVVLPGPVDRHLSSSCIVHGDYKAKEIVE